MAISHSAMQPLDTATHVSQETSAAESVDDQEVLVSPPQFGLRTLLLALAALSALFGVMKLLGARSAAALAFFLLLISAHVIANFWGERHRHRRLQRKSTESLGDHVATAAVLHALSLERVPTHLATQTGPAHGIARKVGLGASSGAMIGGLGLGWVYWNQQAWVAVGFGALSAAVLGGVGSFLAVSCFDVLSQALGEAAGRTRRPR